MLSLFPQLFTYQELAPFILRIISAAILIGYGYPKIFRPREYMNFSAGIAEFLGGIFLALGFLTQLGAGLNIITTALRIIRKEQDMNYYALNILLTACLISLMLLGPGIFSIDLPL